MKKAFLPLVFGLLFASCSRDNDSNMSEGMGNSTKETPILVTKWTDDKGGVGEFSYDGDKLLKLTVKEGNDVAIYNFKYEGDFVVEKSQEGIEGNKTTYSYKNNRLDTVIEKYVEIDDRGEKHISDIKRTYTYEGNDIVKVVKYTKKVYTAVPNEVKTKTENFTFTLSNGNLVKSVLEIDNQLISTTTFTYDNNKNIFSNVRGLQGVGIDFYIEGVFGEEMSMGKNNLISIKVEGEGFSAYTYKYEYKYNNGYPIKQTETYQDSSGIKPSIFTVNFEYNK